MLNENVKKLLKENMWDLATCSAGVPNVVPVAFKDETGDGKLVVGDVSLATTLPGLAVSVAGVRQGEGGLAVGNAVGSVTANLGLILGISVVCIPSVVSKKQFNLKAVLMVSGAALLLVLCRGGGLAFLPSMLLFAIFAV